jgi:hypothetical protein
MGGGGGGGGGRGGEGGALYVLGDAQFLFRSHL